MSWPRYVLRRNSDQAKISHTWLRDQHLQINTNVLRVSLYDAHPAIYLVKQSGDLITTSEIPYRFVCISQWRHSSVALSQITENLTDCSTVFSTGTTKRIPNLRSRSLWETPLVKDRLRDLYRWPVDSRHKVPVMRKTCSCNNNFMCDKQVTRHGPLPNAYTRH